MIAIWQLVSSKAGIIAIAIALLLATGLYYKSKAAAVEALHTIEISGLKGALIAEKTKAQELAYRNTALELDIKISLTKIAAQNDAVARLQIEAGRKSAAANKAALDVRQGANEIKKKAGEGTAGREGMNDFFFYGPEGGPGI